MTDISLRINPHPRSYDITMKFLVHTDVTAREMDPFIFIKSVPEMFAAEHVAGVKFLQGYVCNFTICHCAQDRKLMCLLDGPDQETVRNALKQIELPITAILPKPN